MYNIFYQGTVHKYKTKALYTLFTMLSSFIIYTVTTSLESMLRVKHYFPTFD